MKPPVALFEKKSDIVFALKSQKQSKRSSAQLCCWHRKDAEKSVKKKRGESFL